MIHSRCFRLFAVCCIAGLLGGLVTLVACSSSGGGGAGPADGGDDGGIGAPNPGGFTITGRVFTASFDGLAMFDLSVGGQDVRNAFAIELFTETPTDSPSACTLFIESADVQMTGQTGSVTVTASIGAGDSTTPCDDGRNVGSFTVSYDGAAVSLGTSELSLSGTAFSYVRSGRFTLCLAASGNMDATLEITELGVRFAASTDAGPGPSPDEPFEQEFPPPTDLVPEEASSVTELVLAAAGGTVTASGAIPARVEIPPGALAEDTEVSVTLVRGENEDAYELGVLVGPAGIRFSQPVTLVIPLDPPLPEGTDLNILDLVGGDSTEILDTGFAAEISPDRTEARIPFEPVELDEAKTFQAAASPSGTSGRKGKGVAHSNCFGGTQTDSVQGIMKKFNFRDPDLAANFIMKKVRAANTGPKALSPAELNKLDAEVRGAAQGKSIQPSWGRFRAFLKPFYYLEPESKQLNGCTDPKGNFAVEKLSPKCRKGLTDAAMNSEIPPVIIQGRKLSEDASDNVDGVMHSLSAKPDQKTGKKTVLNQTLNITDSKTRKLFENARKKMGESTDAVVETSFDEINGFQRNARSGEVVEREMKRMGSNFKYRTPVNKRGRPWPAARVLMPRPLSQIKKEISDAELAICEEADVLLPCVSDADCLTSQHCASDGYCARDDGDGNRCESDADCAPGQTCNPDGYCVSVGGNTLVNACWEVVLDDAVAHVDVISGLPDDVDPADIPSTIPANDAIGSAASSIYELDDSGRLERLWLSLPEPMEGIDTMEFMRFTLPNVLLVPDMMSYSDIHQHVSVSGDGSSLDITFGFTINASHEGVTAKARFTYAISDAMLIGSPPDRFESGAFASELYGEATNPETGEPIRIRVTGTATASGMLSIACPDPLAENVLSQEEMLALMEEQLD